MYIEKNVFKIYKARRSDLIKGPNYHLTVMVFIKVTEYWKNRENVHFSNVTSQITSEYIPKNTSFILKTIIKIVFLYMLKTGFLKLY